MGFDRDYKDESPYKKRVTDEAVERAGQVRRRKEDILEGLRLEREAFDDVWDLDAGPE